MKKEGILRGILKKKFKTANAIKKLLIYFACLQISNQHLSYKTNKKTQNLLSFCTLPPIQSEANLNMAKMNT